MTDRQLYSITIPKRVLSADEAERSKRVASEGVLESDVPEVSAIAPQSSDKVLNGETVGELQHLTAAEISELMASESYSPVPFAGVDGEAIPDDGYYELVQGRVKPRDPRETRVQEFRRVRLKHVGTPASHWRAVYTNPTTEDNPFGTASTAEIGISQRASKVRWVDTVGGTLSFEDATVQRTVETEFDRVDVYDATEPSFSKPTLIFRQPLHTEWRADARVWDDRDRKKWLVQTDDGATIGNASVGEATVARTTQAIQWQQVFVTRHKFEGHPVIENKRLRLEFDEDRGKLSAYRWSADSGIYEILPLGTSSWRLYDLDLMHVGQARIDAQVEFQDTSQNSLTTHNLNMSLKRGYDDALWLNPSSEGAVPQGLIDRLDPIAATSEKDPAAVMDVIKRSDVRA